MESLILIILVIIPSVWGGDWKVTFERQCALKGTSVVMKCEYDYPGGRFVTSVDWFKAQRVSGEWRLFYLSSLKSPPDHFTYVGDRWSDCSLQINDVQPSDEGRYYFSFRTTISGWTSRNYARLYVKELTIVVQPSTVTEGDQVSLTCVSGCPTPVDVAWFRDGQPVRSPVFKARREDAGRYYCAILGQEMVRSASVALNVQYAPMTVTLSMSPLGDAVEGSSVTFTCSGDANPPVTQSGYRLYKDGHFINSGQNHIISDIQPGHTGLYHCQAWNNISWRGFNFMNSTEVHLDVQYRPVNVSVSMNPPHVVEGSSVNLSCSSAANPAAHSYTWYMRAHSPSSMQQVGSGQVLYIPSLDASHTGQYFCQARSPLGENNSTEVLLAMKEEQHGSQTLPIIAGVGAFLIVTLVFTLLLLWRKQKTHTEKIQTVCDYRLNGRGSSSSATEDQSNIYVNIHMLSTSPPPVTDISPHSQRSSHDAPTSYEDEVTYSTVTIKPRKHKSPHHMNNSRAQQDSRSKARENDDSVIYATVAKSS